jgi:hypothetical protein
MMQAHDFVNGPRRDRTCDPLIKSLPGRPSAPGAPRAWPANRAERFVPRRRRRERGGTEPHGSAPSWLQDGCRIPADTGRK